MDKRAPEAVKSLHQWGFAVRTDPTVKYATHGETGRPDLMCVRNGWGIHVEVKNGATGFDFSQWNEKQREWAKSFGNALHLWFWLCLGEYAPSYDPQKYDIRMTWLFPWHVMAEIEEKLKPYSGTLPYKAKHQKIDIQNQGFVAPILLAPYRLQWNKGVWELPTGHPFHLYNMPLPSITGLSEKLPNGNVADSGQPT